MPRSARHTMGGREVLDAKTMLDLLEGSASDGGPTVTIDVDVFKDNFGAPPPRRSSLSGGRRSSSSGASRRRETADPAQLKELLQACLLEGNDAAAAASPTSQPPRPAPRRSPRFAKPRRRMTCDPRLLNRLVMEHSGEIPTIPEETSATESLTSNPYRGGVLVASPSTDWRNGSASDSSPEGYAFESRIGHWGSRNASRRRSTHRLTSNLTSNPATSNLTSGVSNLTSGTGLESFEESRAAAAHEDPQEDEADDDDEDDVSYARPVAARSSIAWTFDETRATMQELRRQLQIEKEVSRDAERERDELARELSGMRAEQAARSEVQQALEAQRDAAAARASSAEGRATRADAALGRQSQEFAAIDADLAAREREIEQNAERVKLEADARVAAAERDKAEAEAELLALRDEAAALRARVAQLEKVKITSGLAAKIQKVVQERDELLAAARKGGRFNDENAAPFGAEDLSQAGGECRQS